LSQQTFDFVTAKPPVLPDAPERTRGPAARRNLVIEASAGTGKTTAIVGEVLRLMIEREDLSPERIVLMTFTEKAAGEIADRIRKALEDLSLALDDEGEAPPCWPVGSDAPLVTIDDPAHARRTIAHHLANLDSLRSQTIHSFCQSLLRSFPLEAGLDPQFTIIEGFERSLLYSRVYDAWIDAETRLDPPAEIVAEWELLFTHVGYLFLVRELVMSLADRRDLLEEAGYDLGDFDEVRESIAGTMQKIRECNEPLTDAGLARIFEHVRGSEPQLDSLEDCIAWLEPIVDDIRDANLPRKDSKLKEIVAELRNGDKGGSIYDSLVSHRAAVALLAITRRFVARLDDEKRRLGVVDFDDLLLRTLALLDDETVLTRAREQFDYIFVDEFQDTDRTQARIIDRLARDASGTFVPGKTIVVGDPKQSIYGFRRADPETYYRMTTELREADAERRLIADQYRSDRPLLDVVNAMFTRLFKEEPHDPNVFRPAYEPVNAARKENHRELDARVTMLRAESEEKGDRCFGEAEAIARWIAARREPGNPKDLQRFAILFRRLTILDDYLDVFDRYGIDYVLPPTRLFLDRRAPVDLLAVLRAVAYPFDKGAQISAARTPYFALTDVEIAHAGDAWNAFAGAMAQLREAAHHETVSGLIDRIVATSGIEAVYEAAVDTDRTVRHLEHVRAIAFEYDERVGGSVRQFVDEIARRRAEPDEMEPTLLDESQNAVRIMSVHAAKGLEFDTVILPDLPFETRGQGSLRIFTVEEPKSLVVAGSASSISATFRTAKNEPLSKISSRRDEAEMRRLFYVAVTRAKTDVVFVCGPEPKKTGFMKCLLEVLEIDRKELTSMWPAEGRIVHPTAIGELAFEVAPAVETPGAQRVVRLRDRTLEESLSTGTIVETSFADPEPGVEPLSAAEVAMRRSGVRGRAAGTLLHRALELWDGRSDVGPLLDRLASEAAADREVVARVRRRLSVIARSPTLERILRAETLGRELPVRFVQDGELVERRIDRLIREDGVEVVIDYKSGKPAPDRIERDREQVARYCGAIAAITGRPCRGLLWYVDLETDVVVEVAARTTPR
jgi:ATP-dependent helicase/nuclease subunit A